MGNKLEQLLDESKKTNNINDTSVIMEEIKNTEFLVLASLPKDTPVDFMKKLISNNGQATAIPDGVVPEPVILQNSEGKNFLPIFTSRAQIEINQRFAQMPITLTMSFKAAMEYATMHPEIAGSVVNPFSHNLSISANPKKQENKITLNQYHALARKQFETVIIPKMLFETKDNFLEELKNQRGEFLRDMYEEVYKDEIACPYTSDDFEIMALNISDSLQIYQVSMPEKNKFPHLCETVYLAIDSETKDTWYYAIVYEGRDKERSLVEITNDGKAHDLKAAPAPGNEINKIISCINKN